MSGLIGRIPKLALAGLALVIGAAIAVAAFAATDSGSSSTAAGVPDPAAMQELQQCLSEHGVTPPQGAGASPQAGGVPPSGQRAPSSKLQQAFQACRQYAPQGGPPSGLAAPGAPPSGLQAPTPGS